MTLESLSLTHCRVFETAGEGHSTALPTRVELSAVEVDVQVPVVWPVSSTTRPLRQQQQQAEIRQLTDGFIFSDLVFFRGWLRSAWVVNQLSVAVGNYRQRDSDGETTADLIAFTVMTEHRVYTEEPIT